MTIPRIIRLHMAKLGKKGGKRRADGMSAEDRSEACRKAAKARWAKWRKERA